MKHKFELLFLVPLIFYFTSCNNKIEKNVTGKSELALQEVPENVIFQQVLVNHSRGDNCLVQFELKDSLKLKHIKNQFYKSTTGHLYQKTVAQREVNGHLADVIYFNGYFSQEIDPLSFEELDGWYAKDLNNVYYYRPTSGGMLIVKLEKADVKSFKILDGHYKYASDKNNFYNETEIIEGFKPNQTILTLDKKKRVRKMLCGNKKYKFEVVNE
ncbi:MAG: DKNYY domain-containing protein [Limnohabitans sp.]|nr:DKNYY domain-containing protein [Limnohabitans sp.]